MDTKTIEKIAKLAHIQLQDAEKQGLAEELSKLFDWIEELQEVNTDHTPMLMSVSETALPWREDVITDGNKQKDILANAPKSEFNCFVVPKVINDE